MCHLVTKSRIIRVSIFALKNVPDQFALQVVLPTRPNTSNNIALDTQGPPGAYGLNYCL